MQVDDLYNLIEKVLKEKHESQTIELKAARRGRPEKLYDTLSSFSNQDEGGVIIFGIRCRVRQRLEIYNSFDISLLISL